MLAINIDIIFRFFRIKERKDATGKDVRFISCSMRPLRMECVAAVRKASAMQGAEPLMLMLPLRATIDVQSLDFER